MELTFGEHLHKTLVERGLTKYRLWKLSGVSESLLGRIERGEREPTDEVLRKLAGVQELGVPYAQLRAWADTDLLGEERLTEVWRLSGGWLAKVEAARNEIDRLGAEKATLVRGPRTPTTESRVVELDAMLAALVRYLERIIRHAESA